jgi:1-acyl-sn-glycerol-3-phosphate acyltransferase
VAHNAGEFWGRNAFIKNPGTITVSIGASIDPGGMETGNLNAKVEAWIEAEMIHIGDQNHRKYDNVKEPVSVRG